MEAKVTPIKLLAPSDRPLKLILHPNSNLNIKHNLFQSKLSVNLETILKTPVRSQIPSPHREADSEPQSTKRRVKFPRDVFSVLSPIKRPEENVGNPDPNGLSSAFLGKMQRISSTPYFCLPSSVNPLGKKEMIKSESNQEILRTAKKSSFEEMQKLKQDCEKILRQEGCILPQINKGGRGIGLNTMASTSGTYGIANEAAGNSKYYNSIKQKEESLQSDSLAPSPHLNLKTSNPFQSSENIYFHSNEIPTPKWGSNNKKVPRKIKLQPLRNAFSSQSNDVSYKLISPLAVINEDLQKTRPTSQDEDLNKTACFKVLADQFREGPKNTRNEMGSAPMAKNIEARMQKEKLIATVLTNQPNIANLGFLKRIEKSADSQKKATFQCQFPKQIIYKVGKVIKPNNGIIQMEKEKKEEEGNITFGKRKFIAKK